MKSMVCAFRSSIMLVAVMTLLLGGVYPALVTGIAQGVLAHKANGSLILKDGKVIGSELIGQQFDNEWYFWSRPSYTQPPYNGAASGGSNLGPANEAQLTNVMTRARQLQKADAQNNKPIPADLVTGSGSGLDPHITVGAARYQARRVAEARHLPVKSVEHLIDKHAQAFGFGYLAKPYVNVLELNLALDELAKKRAAN
jgi:K+-transporting ATPase KdpC subunit